MEILVCVKQVPDTAEVKIDPVKHTVIRAGVPNIFNPLRPECSGSSSSDERC